LRVGLLLLLRLRPTCHRPCCEGIPHIVQQPDIAAGDHSYDLGRLVLPRIQQPSATMRPTCSRSCLSSTAPAICRTEGAGLGDAAEPPHDGAVEGSPIVAEPAADVGAADARARSPITRHPIATFLLLVYATITALPFVPRGWTEPAVQRAGLLGQDTIMAGDGGGPAVVAAASFGRAVPSSAGSTTAPVPTC
jgi:hypothetical protein